MANLYKQHCIDKTCFSCVKDVATFSPLHCVIYTDKTDSCDGCEHYEKCILKGDPANAPLCEECANVN